MNGAGPFAPAVGTITPANASAPISVPVIPASLRTTPVNEPGAVNLRTRALACAHAEARDPVCRPGGATPEHDLRLDCGGAVASRGCRAGSVRSSDADADPARVRP